METLQRLALDKRLRESAAQQCAPVIFGIKPSNLLIIERETAYVLKSLIDATGLKVRCLSPYSRRQVWFLFNESALDAQLKDAENRAFIESLGYAAGLSLDEMLLQLCRRFQAYKCGETGFPHELGVFLGYPLCDVRGFIENQGKNYLYSGYWKVYDNENETKMLFRRYENVRNYAVSLVRQGKDFSHISLRSLNYAV